MMNCSQCNTRTEERWLLTSKFEWCPVCKEDANVLAKSVKAPSSGSAESFLSDTEEAIWKAYNAATNPPQPTSIQGKAYRWVFDANSGSYKLEEVTT